MLCPECKIEMLVDRMGPDGPVLICVNPRCPQRGASAQREGGTPEKQESREKGA